DVYMCSPRVLVEHMGALIQAGKSLAGITAGSLLGLFSMGLFLPWTNATGALTGGIASTLLVGWISLGTQAAMIREFTPLSFNNVEFDRSGTFFLYRLSYLYYTLVGMIVCIVVGSIVSYFTGPNDPTMVHRDLLTPMIHRWLPEQHPHCRRPRLTQHDIELHARELEELRANSAYNKIIGSQEGGRQINNNINIS
ncbi:unnamed protein product, partial [Arctia plantaginis]